MFFFKNNWPTFNFKNGVHQQKKNKKQKRFVINQEPFPQARMKDSLKNTMLPFESASEKN